MNKYRLKETFSNFFLMFQNRSISGKLMFCIWVLVIVLTLSSTVLFMQIRNMKRDVEQIIHVKEPLERAFMDMEIVIDKTIRETLYYVRDIDDKHLETMLTLDNRVALVTDKIDALSKNSAGKALAQEINNLYWGFRKLNSKVTALAKNQEHIRQLFRADVKVIEKMINDKTQKIFNNNSPDSTKKLESLLKMEIALDDTFIAIESYVDKQEPVLIQQMMEKESAFIKAIEAYRSTDLSEIDNKWLNGISGDFKEAVLTGNRIINSSNMMNELLKKFEKDMDIIENIMDDDIYPLIRSETARAEDNVKASGANALAITISLGIMSILIIAGTNLAVRRNIVRSMSLLSEGAKKIGDGMLDYKIRIESRDEFSELADSFNRMAEKRMKADKMLRSSEEERKNMEKALLEIEERERRRIGHDLHDDLGQQLAGISFKSQCLENDLKEKSAPEAERIAKITYLINIAKDHVKRLSRGLSPMVEKSDGNLITVMKELVSNTGSIYKIPCILKCDKDISVNDNTIILQLYRIAQEAVTNAVKHAGPEHITIFLNKKADEIKMTIRDNGTGINLTGPPKGMGLEIMKYRAGMIGAAIDIQPDTSGGTVVTCILPCTEKNSIEEPDKIEDQNKSLTYI